MEFLNKVLFYKIFFNSSLTSLNNLPIETICKNVLLFVCATRLYALEFQSTESLENYFTTQLQINFARYVLFYDLLHKWIPNGDQQRKIY